MCIKYILKHLCKMYFEMLEVNGGWHVKFSMPDKIKIKNRDETEMYESMFPFFILA